METPKYCNKILLCAYAEIEMPEGFVWNTKRYPQHVEEAKRRGMKCRVKDDIISENIKDTPTKNKDRKINENNRIIDKNNVIKEENVSPKITEFNYKNLNPRDLDCKGILKRPLSDVKALDSLEKIEEFVTLSIAKKQCGEENGINAFSKNYKLLKTSKLNMTTDSYVKNKYICMAAKLPNIRPILQEDDLFKTSESMLIDLTGDGKPESIYSLEGTYHFDEKNPDLSRKPSQYLFYSENTDIEIPDNSKFMNARQMLVQDLNGDGKDDGIFIQHGPDYKPFERHENKIMLSSPKGYQIKTLPGDKALYHGASAGDVDNDGDIDIIVSPGYKSRVYAYINNGKGKFKTKYLTRDRDHSLNVLKLWDVDDDGYLDLLTNSKHKIQVFWGNGSVDYFKGKPTEIETTIGGEEAFATDFTFGEGKNIIFAPITTYYKKYEFLELQIKDRKFVSNRTIGSGKGWVIFVNSCDLQNDGDIDILNFGAGEMAWRIWVNVNNKETPFLNIPLPNIYLFKDGMHDSELAVLERLYEIFSISQTFYVPKQTYYPNTKYQSDSFYYLLNTDTNEFCSIFKNACNFSKRLSLLN